jgi:hypothetical protein
MNIVGENFLVLNEKKGILRVDLSNHTVQELKSLH